MYTFEELKHCQPVIYWTVSMKLLNSSMEMQNVMRYQQTATPLMCTMVVNAWACVHTINGIQNESNYTWYVAFQGEIKSTHSFVSNFSFSIARSISARTEKWIIYIHTIRFSEFYRSKQNKIHTQPNAHPKANEWDREKFL